MQVRERALQAGAGFASAGAGFLGRALWSGLYGGNGLCMRLISTSLNSGLDQAWNRLGAGLDQAWTRLGTSLGQAWNRLGPGFGQAWTRLGPHIEPGLDQAWTRLGPGLGQAWTSQSKSQSKSVSQSQSQSKNQSHTSIQQNPLPARRLRAISGHTKATSLFNKARSLRAGTSTLRE